MPSAINDSFIITSTNKEEIYKKISSLSTSKSCEPNSIQDQITSHLATICNVKLSTGFFPAILKTAKVISIHKKYSILDPFIHLSDLLTADVLTLTKKKCLIQAVCIQKRYPNKPCQLNYARKYTESTR